jgi:ubiquinone/menaquinone biosynthesis C-methylase UbiE
MIWKRVIVFYNNIADQYAKRYEGLKKVYYKKLESDVIKKFIDFKNQIVLDLGTGPGWFPFEISEIIKKGVGIDFSSKMIEIAKKKCQSPNITFFVMDARKLHLPKNYFDVTTSLGMFEYVNNLKPFLMEIIRVLKKDGDFVFTCRNQKYMFPFFSPRCKEITYKGYNIYEIREILRAYKFKLINVISIFHLPEKYVWFVFRMMPNFLKKYYIFLIVILNKLLRKLFPLNGFTLIFHCRRVV